MIYKPWVWYAKQVCVFDHWNWYIEKKIKKIEPVSKKSFYKNMLTNCDKNTC